MTSDEKITFAIEKYTQQDGWSFARIAEAVGENNKWVDRIVHSRRLMRHPKYIRVSPVRKGQPPEIVARVRELYEGPDGYAQEAIGLALGLGPSTVSLIVKRENMQRHPGWAAKARMKAATKAGEQTRINRLHNTTPPRDDSAGHAIALAPWPELEKPNAPRFEDHPVVAERNRTRFNPVVMVRKSVLAFSSTGCAMRDL